MKRTLIAVGVGFWLLILAVTGIFLIGSMTGTLPGWMNRLKIGGGNMIQLGGEVSLHAEETISAQGLEKLDIMTSYQDIDISLTDGTDITLKHYDYDNAPDCTVSNENGILTISAAAHKVSVQIFGFGSIGNAPRLELFLPRSYAEDVVLSASSGTINVAGKPEWDSAKLTASSGTLKLEDGITCAASLRLTTTSGGIRMSDIQAASLSVNASSGSIKLQAVNTSGSAELHTTSGSIRTGDISAASFTGDSSSGSQEYGKLNVQGELYLKTTSGSLRTAELQAASLRSESSSASHTYGHIKVADMASVKSSSGSLKLQGGLECARFDIGTTSASIHMEGDSTGGGHIKSSSGNITIDRLTMQGDTNINATSGTVKVTMAQGQGYQVEATVTSGSIKAEGFTMNYRDERSKQGYATIGDGKAGTLSINTSSGGIRIN